MNNSAPTIDVMYQCAQSHVSEIKYHAQVTDYPKTIACKRCHKEAKFIASSKTPTDEYIPDPKRLRVDMKGSELVEDEPELIDDLELDSRPLSENVPGGFTFGHLKALKERRTNEELEALLQERLEILRASRAV